MKDATPIPVEDRDVFSSMEKYVEYGDFPYAIWWSKGLIADKRGKMQEGERIEISSGYTDEDGETISDEHDVVYQGVFLPEEGLVEIFCYCPDVWSEHLENRARANGIIT